MRTTADVPAVPVSCVLVVDDHRMFAELLAHRLRREAAIEHAKVACTVQQARAAVDERAPDVVLLDPDLEGGSALELIGDLRLLVNRPQVVVLADAAHEPPSTVGLDREECGWISKESPFEDMVETIEAVRRGRPPRHPARRGFQALEARPTRLTARQAEVLACLVTGMTRAQVSTGLGLSAHTVRDHVRHLFSIAEVTSTADLLAWAWADEVVRPPRLQVVRGP